MPGIVVFRRRWSVGSDDFVVPAVFLVVLHVIWIFVLGAILAFSPFDATVKCVVDLQEHIMGYMVILGTCLVIEACIMWVSMRGSILYVEPRNSMQYLLYIRMVVLLVEFSWMIVGVLWITKHYGSCQLSDAKYAVMGIMICNWIIMLSVLLSVWCTFDAAGRSWVKMKRYQESLKERDRKGGRRSGSRRRNWRHRIQIPFLSEPRLSRRSNRSVKKSFCKRRQKAIRQYEQSWDRRFRMLFCCMSQGADGRNTFTEIAKLFTEFFRELDVVPSDVVAGLMLLRTYQKNCRKLIVSQGSNDVYQYLSSVPITPRSRFLHLNDPETLSEYKSVIHNMHYALAAYGWPMYVMMHSVTGICNLTQHLRCGGCGCGCQCLSYSLNCCGRGDLGGAVVRDNCCHCNYAALKKMSGLKDSDIVYVTFHVDIGETPFFVAIDHKNKSVVVSIRGTLSLQDVLTDLKAEAESLPVEPVREDWLGHKGMVEAALYIKRKLKDEMILANAFRKDRERKTHDYGLVLVGHSLGAGTAAILAILLRQEYPTLHCYAYSPPGGLLSMTAVEETKSFITSVVVGKDVVPRIGLSQMEAMRSDLIKVIKRSQDPKWKVIFGSVSPCCGNKETFIPVDDYDIQASRDREVTIHPSDSQLALTSHVPLYPPGKIIHIVRNHPHNQGVLCGKKEPVYQAIWADNTDLDEVIISPTMINDHMPDQVLAALKKVLVNIGPSKPTRKCSESERRLLLTPEPPEPPDPPESTTPDQDGPARLYLETSFTDLVPDTTASLSRPLELLPSESQQQMDVSLEMEAIVEQMAPLATPETMSISDSSSSDSGSVKRFSTGSQRRSVSVMDPILQSPIQKKGKPDAFCYLASEGVSNRKCFVTDCQSSNGGILVNNVFTTKATIENDGASKKERGVRFSDSDDLIRTGSSENMLDAILSACNQRSGSRDLSHQPEDAKTSGECKFEHLSSISDQLKDVSRVEINESCPSDFDQSQSSSHCNFDQSGTSNAEPVDHSQRNGPVSRDFVLDASEQEERYDKHSPTFSNQMEYHSVGGHYSPGGRGYPHGAYQRPLPDRSRHKNRENLIDVLSSSDDSDKALDHKLNEKPRFRRYNSVETSQSSDNDVMELVLEHKPRATYISEVPGKECLGPMESDV